MGSLFNYCILTLINMRLLKTTRIFFYILEAAAVAFDQMFQEDFSHPITRYLSWYACHKFWKNVPQENIEKEQPPEDEVNFYPNYIKLSNRSIFFIYSNLEISVFRGRKKQ